MYDHILQRALLVREQINDGYLPDTGLCSACHFYDLRKIHQIAMFAAWPEYSGEPDYPVPAPADFEPEFPLEHQPACEQLFNSTKLYEGEYGAARLRLLDHCIEWLKAQQ